MDLAGELVGVVCGLAAHVDTSIGIVFDIGIARKGFVRDGHVYLSRQRAGIVIEMQLSFDNALDIDARVGVDLGFIHILDRQIEICGKEAADFNLQIVYAEFKPRVIECVDRFRQILNFESQAAEKTRVFA